MKMCLGTHTERETLMSTAWRPLWLVTVPSSGDEGESRLRVKQERGEAEARAGAPGQRDGRQPRLLSHRLSPGIGWSGDGPCRGPGGDSGRENCSHHRQSAHMCVGWIGSPIFMFTWNLRVWTCLEIVFPPSPIPGAQGSLFIHLFSASLCLRCHAGFIVWLQHLGSSLRWLLLLRSMGSRAQAQYLWHMGLVAPRHVGSSWTGDRTRVSCIGRWIHDHWAFREAQKRVFADVSI